MGENNQNIKFSAYKPDKERNILNPVFQGYYKIIKVSGYGGLGTRNKLIDDNCLISQEFITKKLNFIRPNISDTGLLSWNIEINYTYKGSRTIFGAYLRIEQKENSSDKWLIWGGGDYLICIDWLVCTINDTFEASYFSFISEIDKIQLSNSVLDDISIGDNPIDSTNGDETQALLNQFRNQYEARDDKCLITLSKYARIKGNILIKREEYDQGLIYLDDALKIVMYKHSQYVKLYGVRKYKSKWLPVRKNYYDNYINSVYVSENKPKDDNYYKVEAAIVAIKLQTEIAKEDVNFIRLFYVDTSYLHIFKLIRIIIRSIINSSNIDNFQNCKKAVYEKINFALEIIKNDEAISTKSGLDYERIILDEITKVFLFKLYYDKKNSRVCLSQITSYPEMSNKGALKFLSIISGNIFNFIEKSRHSIGPKMQDKISEAIALKEQYCNIAENLGLMARVSKAKLQIDRLRLRMSENDTEFDRNYEIMIADLEKAATNMNSSNLDKNVEMFKRQKYLYGAEFAKLFEDKIKKYKEAEIYYNKTKDKIYYFEARFFHIFFEVMKLIESGDLLMAINHATSYLEQIDQDRIHPRLCGSYDILRLISFIPKSESEIESSIQNINEYRATKKYEQSRIVNLKHKLINLCNLWTIEGYEIAVKVNIPLVLKEVNSELDLMQSFAQQLPREILEEVIDSDNIDEQIMPGDRIGNILKMSRALEACMGHIYWIDHYFNKNGLILLKDHINADSVKKIRILTSKKKREYIEQLQQYELEASEYFKNIGISLEIRVLTKNIVHDRYLEGENKKFNIPSVDTVYWGQYAGIKETKNAPPFDVLWGSAVEIKNFKFEDT